METILFVFVGFMCLFLGVKTYSSEEQNKVFAKYPVPVKDVTKYNHACGVLILGFGAVAEFTMYMMIATDGIISILFTLGIIAEAFAATAIYRSIEKKHRK